MYSFFSIRSHSTVFLVLFLIWNAEGFQFQPIELVARAVRKGTSSKPIPFHDNHWLPSAFSVTAINAEDQSTSLSGEGVNDEMTTSTTPSTTSAIFLDRPVLAVLDFVALMAFAAIGKASHAVGNDTTLVQEVGAVALTAFPFIISWFVTSFVTGVYHSIDKRENWLSSSWIQTAKGWIVAVPLGCVGRGLIKGYIPPLPFVIVTMIATFVVLGVTRMGYNFITVAKNSE